MSFSKTEDLKTTIFFVPWWIFKIFLLQRRAKLNGMVAATCRQEAVGWTLVATKRDEFWSSPKNCGKKDKKTQMPSGSLSTIELAFHIFRISMGHATFFSHVLAVLVCQGTLCPVVSGVVTLYKNTMSHGGSTSRCPSSWNVPRVCHFSHV